MIEEDEKHVPVSAEGGGALHYDYYKYLTSLCIISLGGVLALADRVPAGGRGKELLIAALVVICGAAVLAFSGVGEMVRAGTERDAVRPTAVKWASYSPLVLSVGLGMFIYLFVKSLFG